MAKKKRPEHSKTMKDKYANGQIDTGLKRGYPKKDEIKEIHAMMERGLSVPAIAKHLNRTEDCIRRYGGSAPQEDDSSMQYLMRLRQGYFWTTLKRTLIGTEATFFEKAWVAYMSQFGSSSDLLDTDELMIKDLILFDIYSNRSMAANKNILEQISEIESTLEQEMDKDPVDRLDTAELAQLRQTLSSLHSAKTSISKEIVDYQTKKDTKLRDLKGSRDQRYKQVEQSKKNMLELIKVLDTKRKRSAEGAMNEKMKHAMEAVRQDWNQVHEYEDGTLDKPFLSPEGELEDERIQNEQEQAD